MSDLTEYEIDYILYNMWCSKSCITLSIPQQFYDYYYNNISIDFDRARNIIKYGFNNPKKYSFTASKAYRYLKAFDSNDNIKLNKEIQNGFPLIQRPKPVNEKAQLSVQCEALAILMLRNEWNIEIRSTKDFQSPLIPIISGETDGYVIENGMVTQIVEVKCPDILYSMNANEWIDNKKVRKQRGIKKTSNGYQLSPKSPVYCQIQLALNSLNLENANLIYFSLYDLSYIHIIVPRDDNYLTVILSKLQTIFNCYVLPYMYFNNY